jgi:hypothetical protein
MQRSGVIDQDGRFSDLADLRARVEGVYADARRGAYDTAPQVKQAILESEGFSKSFTVDTMRQLQFKPLPDTYDGYQRRVAELPMQAKIGPHAVAPSAAVKGRAALFAALVSIAWDAGTLRTNPMEMAGAGVGAVQHLEDLRRMPKAVRDAISKLPRSLRSLAPQARGLATVGRFAGRAALVLTVAIASWDVYSYAYGQTSRRQFESSMAATAGGLAGGIAGAKVGALIGAAGGPIGVAIGATVGGIVGGVAVAIGSEAAVGSIWSGMDEADRRFAIELVKERIRAAGMSID